MHPVYPDEHEGKCVEKPEDALLTPADRWILSAVNTLAKDVTENMDKFELGIAVQKSMTLSGMSSVTGM